MKARATFWYALAMFLMATFVLPSRLLAQEKIMSPMGSGGDAANCVSVHAVQEDRVVVDCPADQTFDFCFTRNTVDRAGMITGRMEFYSDPSKEAKIQHSPDQIQYNGMINIITDSGVLEMEENGIWDSSSKHWAGLSTITGGRGDFEGATGKLASFGRSDAAGMVIGTICK